MKTALHLIIGVLSIVAVLNVQAQSTRHSRAGGGEWANPSTWLEGSIPTAMDSVVIQSPVTIGSYTNICHSVLVADTGMVGWGSGGGHITVNGSIYNKGSIGTGVYILYGDIHNDSEIGGVDAVIKFRGSDHSITCAPGKSIDAQFIAEDSLQNITLNSDLEIINKVATLGNSELFTQNHVLRIQGGSFQDCRIHASDTLLFNATIGNLVVSGNYKLKGNADILGNLNLEDEAVNYGKIRSLYGAASDLNLYGDFINEDTIEGSTAGNLNVNVVKSAVNHGFWNANVTRFMGPDEKHISQTPGHPFGGTQLSTDNSGSVIALESDVEFTFPGIYLNNNTLNCGLHTLSANSTFDHGTIISESEIQGNSDFWTSQFKGDFRFTGNPRFSNCSTEGNIENTGHMQDITFYGGIFSSFGFLDNKGSITGIHFNIYGNLCNTGTVTDNCIVDVVGDTTQYILLTNAIESQCNFYSDIPGNSYQWMLNGEDIHSQQAQYLFFNTLQLSDAGVYKCRVTTDQGTVYSREIIVNNVTALPEYASLLKDFSVYPNPVHRSSTISFDLKNSAGIHLQLVDPQGRILETLISGMAGSGRQELPLEVSGLKPGIYYLEMTVQSGENISKQALKLLKL